MAKEENLKNLLTPFVNFGKGAGVWVSCPNVIYHSFELYRYLKILSHRNFKTLSSSLAMTTSILSIF